MSMFYRREDKFMVPQSDYLKNAISLYRYRLGIIVKQLGGDTKEIAKKMGIKSVTLISEMRKKNNHPNTDIIRLLEEYYGVNKYWLLFGEGSRFNEKA